MENMGIKNLIKELQRLNPGVKFSVDVCNYPGIIIAECSDTASLRLPEGYECNDKNGLTNKGNTTSGVYEYFEFMTRFEYLAYLD